MPLAATVSVAAWPDAIVWLCGCIAMAGATGVTGGGVGGGAAGGAVGGDAAGGGATLISAAVESVAPALFATRTQYIVVVVSAGVVKLAAVAPLTGAPIAPLAPVYH